MLIGGMQLVAHKVLLKMALVRKLLVIGTFIPLLKHIFFFYFLVINGCYFLIAIQFHSIA
jgi:hypothetical protein